MSWTRPGRRGACRPIVVAHDEDGVRAARGGGALDRVVADVSRRVERQLVARPNPVQLRTYRPHERRVLVGVTRDDRLEVEVDPVGPTIADGGRGLPGEVEAGRRAVQEGGLLGPLAARPGEDRDR